MAAVVSGSSLGLLNSSLYVLGSQGALGQASQGRAGEQVFVNADTGNLVIQNRDELLVGRGPDLSFLRTYNSQGLLNDDNGDNWRLGVYRKVYNLTGTVNTAGSTVTRVAEDGSESVYSFDTASGKYACHDGGGSFDTLSFSSAAQTWTWSWTDGTNQITEVYDAANGGRITSVAGQAVRDQDGNALTFIYNAAGLITQVLDASGESTFLDYNGTDLTQLRTVNSTGQTLIRTRYGYDGSHRLTTVTTDLSPEDASIADGKTYVVSYGYDGTSRRVATLTQTDGNNLAFTYIQVGNDWKVASYTDGNNKTTSIGYTQATTDVQTTANPNNAILPTTETQTTTTTVPAYYTVRDGDSWTTITQRIYNTSDPAAVAALQAAVGTPLPALTVGAHLNVPETLSYNVAGTFPSNGSALSTTLTTVTNYNLIPSALTTSPVNWSAASVLGGAGTTATTGAQTVFDQNGNGMTVWAMGTDLFYRTYSKTNNLWSAAAVLDGTLTGSPTLPNLSMSANGNALVTWMQSSNIYARRYIAGVWDGATTIPNLENLPTTPQGPVGAINNNGRAVVVFLQPASGTAPVNLYANVYNGTTWAGAATAVDDVTTANANSITSTNLPSVAIDGNNNATVLWLQKSSAQPTIDSLHFSRLNPSTGLWGTPVSNILENTTTAVTAASIAFDSNGNGIAIWLQGGTLFTKSYTASTNVWSTTATTLSTATATTPNVSMSSNGNGLVTWIQGGNVMARRYASGAWLGTAEAVESLATTALNPVGSINNSGQAAIAFLQPTSGTTNSLYVNRFSGGAWQGATAVDDVFQTANGNSVAAGTFPSVAIDAQGNVNAVWSQKSGAQAADSVLWNRFNTDTTPYYTIPLNASWASIAAALYGSAALATQLQNSLGNPPLTQNNRLTGFQATQTVTTTSTMSPYYTVTASDNWSSIAQSVYGDVAAAGPLRAALGTPTLAAGLKLTVPASLSFAPTTAPVNGAALTTTETQTGSAPLNTDALTNPVGGWAAPTSVDASSAAASGLLMNSSNDGDAVSVWMQGGSLFASFYESISQLWSAPVLVSGSFTNISGVQLDVDWQSDNAIVTWIDATTNKVYANRGLSNGASVTWGGARLVATATGTLKEAAGAISLDGTSAVTWRTASGTSQSLMVSQWTGTAWAAPEAVAFDTTISAPQIVVTSSDAIEMVFRNSTGDLLAIGPNPDSPGTWISQPLSDATSGPVGQFRVDTDPWGDTNVTWTSGNTFFINWGGSDSGWHGATPLASSPSPISQYAYADSTGIGNVVAWTTTDGKVYANLWGASAPQLLATGTAPADISADFGAAGDVVVAWRDGNNLFATSYTASTSSWGTLVPLESASGAAATPTVAVDNNGNQIAVWLQSDGTATSVFASRLVAGGGTGSPYYTVQASDTTWAIIAQRLYGNSAANSAAGSALQTALNGGATPTVGAQLTGFPTTLSFTVTVTVPAYYLVPPSGATWATVTQAVYGTSDANAQLALREALGAAGLNATPVVGAKVPMPPSIRYAGPGGAPVVGANSTVLSTTVQPYYIATSTDWAAVTQAVYGTSTAAAVAALQAALGTSTLTVGAHLNVPATLNYNVPTTSPSNSAEITPANTTTTTTTTTVPPYYIVQQGDSWSGIALLVYRDAQAGNALRDAVIGGATPTVGAHVRMPQTLVYTKTVVTSTRTDIFDPLDPLHLRPTTMVSDAQGQLKQILSSAVGGVRQSVSYDYDANGNVKTVTDGRGLVTTYDYDTNGNRILERDAAGNTITRVFDSKNELLSETSYVVPDPDGTGPALPSSPLTTRYTYDAANHLRFVVSAEGRVTEYRYNGVGQRITAIQYGGNSLYPIAGLGIGDGISETQLANWVGSTADKTKSLRVDTSYDFRGQVASTTSYDSVDAAGNGVASTASTTQYVYDQAGNLLKTIDPRGFATTDPKDYSASSEYDGLGRMLSTIVYDELGLPLATTDTDPRHRTSFTQYIDALRQTKLTSANGLVTTSTYDATGHLISVLQGTSTTSYFYDANGRLRRTVDPTGVASHILYDDAGRKIATIDDTGSLIEYRYDANNNLTRTIQYATALTQAQLDSLTNAQGPTGITLDNSPAGPGIRPAASDRDRIASNVYDSANRLVKSIDELGFVTQYFYDGAGRQTDTLRSANRVALTLPGSASSYASTPDSAANSVTGDLDLRAWIAPTDWTPAALQEIVDKSSSDSSQFSYLLRLNPDGTLNLYWSSNGTTLSSATSTAPVAAADRTAKWVRAVLDVNNGASGRDIKFYTSDDGATWTQLGATVTQAGVTSVFDGTAPLRVGVRNDAPTSPFSGQIYYAEVRNGIGGAIAAKFDPIDAALGSTAPSVTSFVSATGETWSLAGTATFSTASSSDHLTRNFYDGEGRLLGMLDGEGFLTEYKYNAAGELIESVSYATPTIAALRSTGTLTSLRPAVAAGDIHTFTLYNARGQAVGAVDGEGYLTETVYDAAGNKAQVIRYANKVTYTPGATLASLRPRVLNLPGVTTPPGFGGFAYAPDSPANSVTGSVDLRVKLAMSDWTPPNTVVLLAKDDGATNRDYDLQLATNGALVFLYTADGSTVAGRQAISSASVPFSDGSTGWVSATYNTATGEVKFFTSTDGATFTQLGTTQTVTAGAIHNGGANLSVGAASSGSSPITGKVYYAEVRNGIGGPVVATFDPSVDSTSTIATSFTSSTTPTHEVWTLSGGATLSTGNPQDQVSTYTYTALNQLDSATDALGIRTKYTYDSVGNLTQTVSAQTTADAQTLNAQYDPQGRLTAQFDGLANAVRYTYDADGRRTSVTDRNGGRTLFYYDADGHLTLTIDALGEVTENRYNLLGQLVQTIVYGIRLDSTRLGGTPVEALHGGFVEPLLAGAMTLLPASVDSTTQYTYTLRGQVASVTDPLNQSTTTYTYDADGDVVAKTQAVGKPEVRNTRYVYDADDRLVYTIDAAGGVTKNEYDAADRVTRTIAYTTALSNFTSLPAVPTASDVASRLALSTNDQVLTHVYDRDGREVYTIDALGEVTQRIYDAAGNVIQRIGYAKTIPTNTLPTVAAVSAALVGASDAVHDNNVRLVYDTTNRLVYTIDAQGGVTRNDYDARDNVVRTTLYRKAPTGAQLAGLGANPTVANVQALVVASVDTDQVEQRVFDADDRLVYRIDALGFVEKNDYDALGQVIRTTRFAQAIPTGTATTLTAVAAALAANASRVGVRGLNLTGAAGTFASTPSSAANSVTGDIDLRVLLNPDSWAPAGAQALITKSDGSLDVDYGLRLFGSTGKLAFAVNVTGTSTGPQQLGSISTVGTGFAPGSTHWVRVTRSASTGDVKFYTSDAYDPNTASGTWAQLGATLHTTPGALQVTAPTLQIGSKDTPFKFTGKIYYADVRNVIDGSAVAVKFDPTDAGDSSGDSNANSNAASFVSSSPAHETWTLSGSATLDSPSLTDNQADTFAYDAAGRLIYQVDAHGEITRSDYDAKGNLTKEVRYANTLQGTLVPGVAPQIVSALPAPLAPNASYVVTDDAKDRVTRLVYDADNRLVYKIDALGFVEKTDYDALGQVIRTTRYAQAISIPLNTPPTSADVEQALAANTTRTGIRGLSLSGVAGSFASTPDASANSITGDLDIRAYVRPADWTPAASQDIFTKWQSIDVNQRSFIVRLNTSGGLTFIWSPDGVNFTTVNSTVAVPAADGIAKWVRVAFDVDAAAGNPVTFYTSDDGLAWAQLGAPVTTAGTTSIFDSTAPLVIGQKQTLSTENPFQGEIYYAEFRSGVNGAVVAKFNPADAGDSNATSFASTTGETWTLSSSALDSPSLIANQADTFAYDAAGHLVYHVDGRGEVTQNDYDAAGDVIRTTGYATLVGISSLGVTPTRASVQAQVTVRPTLDHVEQRILDAAGRLLFDIDSAGFVMQRSYDGSGNVTQEVRYANTLQGTFTPGVAPQVVTSAPAGGAYVIADPSRDRVARFVYNAANRPVFIIDAAGFVTQRVYDTSGRIIKETQYANPMQGGFTLNVAPQILGPVVPIPASGSYVVADANRDRTAYHLYDADGRMRFSFDAMGFLTERRFDAFGQEIQRIRYALPVLVGDASTAVSVANNLPSKPPLSAVVEGAHYDNVGRVIDSIDGNGVVTHSIYDAFGNPTDKIEAQGQPEARRTRTKYDALGRLTEQTSAFGTVDASTRRFTFDAFGNQIATIDPRGVDLAERDTAWAIAERLRLGYFVGTRGKFASELTTGEQAALRALYTTVQAFDGVNRKLSVTDPLGNTTRSDYDAFGNIVRAIDPNGNAGYLYYDLRNLQVAQIDPEGNLTEYVYDAAGNKTQTIRYAIPVSVPYDPSRPLATIRPKGLSLPGASGSYAVTPDSPANSVTGDIDMRVQLTHDSWAPVLAETFITKDDLATNRDYGFRFASGSTGKLQFVGSPDGVTTFPDANGVTGGFSVVSTAATGFATGSTHWVRVTRSATTGQIKFYTSDDYDTSTNTGTWTQLGDTIAAPTGAIHDGTAILQVGSRTGAADNPLKGTIYYADVRKVIDGTGAAVVAKFDPSGDAASAGATSFTSSSASHEIWTVSGAAAVVAGSPQDEITKTSYDVLGRVTQIVDAEGHTELFGYDRSSDKASFHQDKNGNVTRYEYDLDGNMTFEHLPVRATSPRPEWQGEQLIENDNNGFASQARVTFDAVGNGFAVWMINSNIYANRYIADAKKWQGAQVIGTSSDTVSLPSLAVDAQGNAIALWVQISTTGSSIYTSRYVVATGVWESAQAIESGTQSVNNPRIAFDGKGNATVVWVQAFVIHARRYDASARAWQSDQIIGNGGSTLDLAVDPQSGNAVAVWRQAGSIDNLSANRYVAATGTWQGAQIVATSTFVDRPQVAIDTQGNAIAVFHGSGGMQAVRYAASTSSGSWQVAQPIGAGSDNAQIAFDAQGNAIAVWEGSDGSNMSIYANRYVAASGTWQGPQLIETIGTGDAINAQIAVDAQGNALAVWQQFDGVRYNIYANRYLASTGTWQGAQAIEGGDGMAINVQLAMDAQGNAIAAWEQTDGTRFNIVANRFDFATVVNHYEYDAFGNKKKETLAENSPEQRVTQYLYDKNDRLIETVEPQVLTQQTSTAAPTGSLQLSQVSTVNFNFSQRISGFLIQGQPIPNGFLSSVDVSLPPIVGYGAGDFKLVWKIDHSFVLTQTAGQQAASVGITFQAGTQPPDRSNVFEVALYKQTSGDPSGDVLIARSTGSFPWNFQGEGSFSVSSQVPNVLQFTGQPASGKTMHVAYWALSDPNNITELDLKSYAQGTFSGFVPGLLPNVNYGYEAKAFDADGEMVNSISGIFSTGSVLAPAPQSLTTAVLQTPHVFKAYDAVGNLIQETDAKGNVTRSYYDANNRLIATVSAERILRQYSYDGAGNLIIQRTYGDPIPDAVGLTALPDPAAIAATNPAFRAANYREADYRYNADNLQVETATPQDPTQQVLVYDRTNGPNLRPQALVSSRQYDKNGNVILDIDADGNKTYSYYDRADRRIAQVDASNFLTTWAYDAAGNVVRMTRYATKVAGAVSTASNPLVLAATAATANDPNDRICLYAYDRMNRLIQETTLGVKVATVDQAGVATDPGTNVVARRRYDNMGNLVAKIQDTAETDFIYDGLGRLAQELDPIFSDLNGATVRNTKTLTYDGVGNVRQVNENGNVTSYEYDPHGNLTRVIDPLLNPTRYYHDLNGNITVKHTRHTNPDGTARGVDALYDYDRINRQTRTTEAKNFTYYVRYNAYDEIVEKGLNGVAQEYDEYDLAGRLIKTNKDDGVDRAYLYDAAGNVTAKIQSAIQDTDLKALTIDLIAGLSSSVVQRTDSVYDARNQLVRTYEAMADFRTDTAAAPQISVDALADPFTGGTMAIGGGADVDFSFISVPAGFLFSSNRMSLNVNLPPILGYGDGDVKIVWKNGSERYETVVASGEHTGNIFLIPTVPAASYQIEIYKETTSGDALVMSTSGTYAFEQGPIWPQYYGSAPLPRQIHLFGYSPDVKNLDFRIWRTGTAKPTTSALVSKLVAGGISVDGHFIFDWSGLSGDYNYEIVPLDAQGNPKTAPVSGTLRLTSWDNPQQISLGVGNVAGAQIASDPNGNAIAVWQQFDGVWNNIWAATYRSATGWQPAQLIESLGGNATDPQIAFDSSGNAIAVWQQVASIVAATYSGGAWQSPQVVGSGTFAAGNAQVAFGPSGIATVVWQQSDGSRTNIWASRYVSGTWETQVPLETDNAGNARNVQIAADRFGNALAVWQQFDGSRDNIWANRYVAGSGWEGARLIENNSDALVPGSTGAVDPQVAMDGDGNAIVVYRQANSNDVNGNLFYGVWANRYVRNVGWEGEQNIIGGSTAELPKLAVDTNGDAMVVAIFGFGLGAQARRYLAGRGWATTVAGGADTTGLENDPFGTSRDTQIEALGNGAFMATWVRDKGGQTTAWSARFDAIAGWSTPDRIGSGSQNKSVPKATANTNGRVTVLWLQSDGVNYSAYASVFQPPIVTSKLVGGYNASNEIVRSQSYNAFGQVMQETDAKGSVTDLTYNTRGDLIKKEDPGANYTDRTGIRFQNVRPTTLYYYDYLDRAVGTKDAAGNQTTQRYDAAGHVLVEYNPDSANNGFRTFGYDRFGNRVVAFNELGGTPERYTYDAKHQLIQVEHPTASEFLDGAGIGNAQRIDTYAYDEEGRRIRHTNGVGSSDLTFYDDSGRVTRTTNAGGFSTQYRTIFTFIDPQHVGTKSITTEQTAQGPKTLEDTKDYFGRLLQHVDLGGHRFAYTYNKAGWLIQQAGDTNAAVPGNEQNIAYTYYQNGNLKEVIDRGINSFSKYEYDKNGNRTFEGYAQTTSSSLAYYESSRVQYDALNRATQIDDPKYTIKYEYDQNGNRRYVHADYHDGLNATPQTQDYWYDYDAMNRFVVTQGSLFDPQGNLITTQDPASRPVGSTIQIGAKGTQIVYRKDSQRSEATYASDGKRFRDVYAYAAGMLVSTTITDVTNPAPASVGSATRKYDAAGEVLTYSEFGPGGALSRKSSYFYTPDGKVGLETSSTYTVYLYDDSGTLLKTVNAPAPFHGNGPGSTIVATLYSYEYWDSAEQSKIQVQANNAFAPGWQPGFSNFIYDVNGHLTQVNDIVGGRALRYALDAHGLVLRRNELTGSFLGSQSSKTQNYYYLNGVGVGDSGFTLSRTDYASVLASRGKDPKTVDPISSADFGSNYLPINDRYPAATPGTYTIQQGDVGAAYDETLRTVALAVWGDASLWYVLADANGLVNGSPNLQVGQTLVVPNVVTNVHNNSGTFKVYDPGEAIGDTTPTLPDPPPPPIREGKCDVAAIIIVAAVVIIVTIATEGATAELLPEALGEAAPAIAAAVGAAAGSAAGQLVAADLGLQKGFSWKQVGMAALAAGVTGGIDAYAGEEEAGLAGELGLSDYLGEDLSSAFNAMVKNVATQALGRLTGWQETGFSWRSAAVAALAAPVTDEINAFVTQGSGEFDDFLGEWVPTKSDYSRWAGDFGTRLTTGFLDGVATQAIRRRVTGSGDLNYANIAANAFGDTLGRSLMADLAKGSVRQTQVPQNAYMAAWDSDDADRGAEIRAQQVLDNLDRQDMEAGTWRVSQQAAVRDDLDRRDFDPRASRARQQAAILSDADPNDTTPSAGPARGESASQRPSGEPESVKAAGGPSGYEATYKAGDGAKRWRDNGSFQTSPRNYDPIRRDEGAEFKPDAGVDINLGDYKDRTTFNRLGDGEDNLLTVNVSRTAGAKLTVNADGFKAAAKVGGTTELVLAKDEYETPLGNATAQVRSVLDVTAGIEAKAGNEGLRLGVAIGAEFVAVQARGDLKLDDTEMLGGLKVGGDISGALNAGAIGGKGQAYAQYEKGVLSFGAKMSASALFGAEVGLNVNIDARPLISRTSAYVNDLGSSVRRWWGY